MDFHSPTLTDLAPEGAFVFPLSGEGLCILGLGATGEAVADYFLSQPSPPKISIYLEKPSARNDAAIARLVERYFPTETESLTALNEQNQLLLSGGDSNRPLSLRVTVDADGPNQDFRLGVASPGIRPSTAFYQNTLMHCDELISEPELAWRISPCRWLAISGTNGKTTTTLLLDHLLRVGGLPSRAAGNIGPTLIDAVRSRASDEYIVAELSSYQLASSRSIAPEAAALLNITPDHIGWHGGFENYAQAKIRIFQAMPLDAPVVIDVTSELCRRIVKHCLEKGRRVIALGQEPGLLSGYPNCQVTESAWYDEANDQLMLHLDGQTLSIVAGADLRIKGAHNRLNALAAAALAHYVGVDANALADGLSSFEPVEHRIEPVAQVAGVRYFNDSKGTNPEATIMALSAFPHERLTLLLGGEDKHTDLTDLVHRALAQCHLVICYGAAGQRFFDAFNEGLSELRGTESSAQTAAALASPAALSPSQIDTQILLAENMREAFDIAQQMAGAGEIILLSPACASFDEFSCFEERGRVFKAWVAALEQDVEAAADKLTGAEARR
jgi:UDP-N-acetylmuramoylalanine--D-glutamate ligase